MSNDAPSNPRSAANAFALLMSRKPPPSTSSKPKTAVVRVMCPICSASVPSSMINAHIDRCAEQGTEKAKKRDPRCKACTFVNPGVAEVCEMCGGGLGVVKAGPDVDPDVDEGNRREEKRRALHEVSVVKGRVCEHEGLRMRVQRRL